MERASCQGCPTLAAALCAVLLLGAGCGGAALPFPRRPVMWQDDDRVPFRPRPGESFIGRWSAVDNATLRPLSELWLFEPTREAVNVNALDEVPDSSWFENRIGLHAMRPDELARGACDEAGSPPTPWRVVSGKSEGAHPGFVIEDADGIRHLLKVDRRTQPEHNTFADVLGAAVFHAAGYHVPCNRLVFFTPEDIERAPDATVERSDGSERPLTDADVRRVVEEATVAPDGRRRAILSRYVDGQPIGPWRFQGVRDDDLNDVVPHEHRREVRAMFVLASWIGHWDLRDPNTLASWVPVDGAPEEAGYVRHYIIDFGDAFGILVSDPLVAERLEHQHWMDLSDAMEDFVTLGLLERPWHGVELRAGTRAIGYYEETRFDPDAWRPGYPTRPYEQQTERDRAWMARIIARFDAEHVWALARSARLSSRLAERALVHGMMGRRRILLERYLTRLSPLGAPRVRAGAGGAAELCAEDLAVVSGIRQASDRRYAARARWPEGRALPAPAIHGADWICVGLPSGGAAARDLVIDLEAHTPGRDRPGVLRVQLYADARGRYAVAGLQRLRPGEERR